jgi:hypothetical protein
MIKRPIRCLALMGLAFATATPAFADPCGMVPPIHISIGPDIAPAIQRDGVQRTYVMHTRGVETMVLRPGFIGSVEEFGMLIPFPSAPAIRKIDDLTFQHIEAAVDPPEVTVQIYDPQPVASWGGMDDFDMAPMRAKSSAAPMEEEALELRRDEVRVISEEAVGMYQVAVIEAGSAKALDKWMAQNEYAYPEGMDDVVEDYVAERWCFVAIKAKVGSAGGATPHPGMRTADTGFPSGASFDGHVQGMGFRFFTDEPVVPMRLSVFNGEDPHNVVYMLTDDPVRIDDVPARLVLDQLDGSELYGNLVDPFGVSWQNGGPNDIGDWAMTQVQQQRNPDPYSGVARDLFAADMLAARTGRLALPFEEEEKELLRISESFGMRGADVDVLHSTELEEQKAEAVDGALDDLKEMHLSVIDGVFPQHVLARQNLTFSGYRLTDDERAFVRNDPMKPADIWLSYPRE